MRSVNPPAEQFDPANAHAPLAAREQIASVSPDVAVRGVFFNFILDELARTGDDEPRRIAFKWYPLTELMELELRAAARLHPQRPLRDGLRLVGRLSYPSLLSTTAGRVLFSVAGLDFRIALTLASKAYALSMTRGTCQVVELHKRWAQLALRDIFNFVDATQIGVFEGAMEAYGVQGDVRLRPIDATNADLLLQWE